MRLLWLLVSLVLLLPVPAAAGVAMPGQESQPTYEAPSDDTRWFVLGEQRSASVAASERRAPRPVPFEAAAPPLGHLGIASCAPWPIAAAPPGTFVPVCQRLPYRATAPPRR